MFFGACMLMDGGWMICYFLLPFICFKFLDAHLSCCTIAILLYCSTSSQVENATPETASSGPGTEKIQTQ
jgi:hypothetical protein